MQYLLRQHKHVKLDRLRHLIGAFSQLLNFIFYFTKMMVAKMMVAKMISGCTAFTAWKLMELGTF